VTKQIFNAEESGSYRNTPKT